jgi:hypothetical protein
MRRPFMVGLLVGVVLVGGAGLFVAVRTMLPGLSTSLEYADSEFQLQPLNVKAAPPWRLERAEGGHLALGDLRGHVALLYFWATW